MDRRSLILAAAVTPLAAGAAGARVSYSSGGGNRLLVKALSAGGFSLQTCLLALRRARNPDLRGLARLEASEQRAYARALGAVPGSVPPSPAQAAMLAQLRTLGGRAFDAAYLRGQILGHEELLHLNAGLANAGPNQVARSVATVAVPSIETHLAILSRLRGVA